MRIVTPIAATALGACVTGVAGGLLALSTAQSRLPAILAWAMKPEPDLDNKVVLVCTGSLTEDSRTPGLDAPGGSCAPGLAAPGLDRSQSTADEQAADIGIHRRSEPLGNRALERVPERTPSDPADLLRRALETEHGEVVMIDLRLPASAGKKRRRRTQALAARLPADFHREFNGTHILGSPATVRKTQ